MDSAKKDKYQMLCKQVEAITEGETDLISVLANTSALIHSTFGFWWTGFYIVKDSLDGSCKELVLGPFQGPVACSRIRKGRGVCGTAWAEDRTIVVPDVEEFPGHIACSSESKSEIVVPIHDRAGNFVAELDIDSEKLATFDMVDAQWLETIVEKIWR